jgi:hypothetical protein
MAFLQQDAIIENFTPVSRKAEVYFKGPKCIRQEL